MGRVDVVARREIDGLQLYALKRLLPALREDPKARAMFAEEAEVARKLRHPNVVRVLDGGEDDQGPFLTMELIRGVSLATLLERSIGELMPLEVALEIARQTAAALEAAHGAGLVHRDVSPTNLLLGFDGRVRLLDFGIAKTETSTTHTTTNVLKGKLGYLAPEQLRFERADARTDLYALGVCLHEALLGERLYAGDSASIAKRIVNAPPPDVCERRRDVPPEVSEVLFDLLAKEREARPASATMLLDLLAVLPPSEPADLSAYLEQIVAAERAEQERWLEDAERILRETTGRVPSIPPRPKRFVWAAAAAAAVLAVGGAVLALREPEPVVAPTVAAPPLAEPTARSTGEVTESAGTRASAGEPLGSSAGIPSSAAGSDPSSAGDSDPSSSADSDSVAESEGEAGDAEASDSTEPAPSPRRRRTRRAPASRGTSSSMMVDTWTWDE